MLLGLLLGGTASLSALYVGLKTGWVVAASVTAPLLAWGVVPRPSTPAHRSTASALSAGGLLGAGLTSALPALQLATGRTLGAVQLAAWVVATSLFGLALGALRPQDPDARPRPGETTALPLRQAAPGLLGGALASATLKLSTLVPLRGLRPDLLLVGVGALMGPRLATGLFSGSLVAWVWLAPWLHAQGLAGAEPTFESVRGWLVWPGATLLVVSGMLALARRWRAAFVAMRALWKVVAEARRPALAGLLACAIAVVALAHGLFAMPVGTAILATVLSLVAASVAREGDPSATSLAHLVQVVAGGLAPGNVPANLVAASIATAATTRPGPPGTSPARSRRLSLASLVGVGVGACVCVPAYLVLATPDRLGTEALPAPEARTSQALSEVVAGGVESRSRGAVPVTADAVEGVPVVVVPAGTRAGDAVSMAQVGLGRLSAVIDDRLVFTEILPPLPTGSRLEIESRGTATVAGPATLLPAVGVGGLAPEGTQEGDRLRATVAGHELWWRVRAVLDAGRRLVLDRALEDPRGAPARPFEGSLRVEVRRESLPPHAPAAIAVAALVALLAALGEALAPAGLRALVPSTAGLGLGLLVGGTDALWLCAGAFLAWGWSKAQPRQAGRHTLPVAAGLVAGGALAGLLVAFATR